MGPFDEVGMTPMGMAMAGASAYAPAAAAPLGTVPSPPSLLDYGDQGLWGQLTGAGGGAGLAGNPLFMAGLQGLVAANQGNDTAQAMARGFSGAQQALRTQEARRRGTSTDRFRQFQMDRLARAEQRQEDQRASLKAAVQSKVQGAPEGSLWDTYGELLQNNPQMAEALFKAELEAGLKPPGTAEGADGHLYYTTGPAKGQRVLPGVTKAAEWGAVGDDYLYNKATGETRRVGTAAAPGAFDREEIAKQARDMDATNESWVEASLAGDPTLLKPRDPMDVPADRGEVSAFLDKAEAQLKPLRKQAGAYKRLQIALQEGSSIADVMSIYETIKALDPESVVREGEIAIVKAAMPTLQRLEGVLRRESNQGFLTPKTRAELASVSAKIQGALERSAQKTIADLGKRAGVLRMPENVMEGTSQPSFGEQSVWEDIISRAGGGAPVVTSDNPEVEQFVPTRF